MTWEMLGLAGLVVVWVATLWWALPRIGARGW